MPQKTLVVFRHGQGTHQLSRSERKAVQSNADYAKYGACLTDVGRKQAAAIQDQPIFRAALSAESEGSLSLFVASPQIRAIETMATAAPGRTILILPDAREIGAIGPRLADLQEWASTSAVVKESGCGLDLRLYSDEQRVLAKNEDGKGCGKVTNSFLRSRRILDFIARRPEEIIFLAAHGGQLSVVDRYADGIGCAGWLASCVGAMCHCYMSNCEVRKYLMTTTTYDDQPMSCSETDAACEMHNLCFVRRHEATHVTDWKLVRTTILPCYPCCGCIRICTGMN